MRFHPIRTNSFVVRIVFFLVLALATTCPAQSSFFTLRGRVLESGGAAVTTNTFKFALGASNVWSKGKDWSPWIRASGGSGVLRLLVTGGKDPCKAQLEVQIEGQPNVRTFNGELYGSTWGLMTWFWAGHLYVTPFSEYNRMFWNNISKIKNPDSGRPKYFPIADRFISGDNDRINLKEGIEGLAKAGFSVLMIDGEKFGYEYLLQTGLRRTAEAAYCPPGGAHDHNLKNPQASSEKWANDFVRPLTNAGFARTDLALMALADETGWYYPHSFPALTNNPVALARFRTYLADQGLKPSDVGARKWDTVFPAGRSQAEKDIEGRRLFYWTMRFFPWDSSRYYAECTRALENAFYTNMPIFVNWNFFSGRCYVPGGVANNPNRNSPDAAMGGHDWFEFARMRGSTMLWTEDWFGDYMAYQWSYYCARLNSAARLGGIEFGGYIVPRTAGDQEDGIIQKIVSLIGHGAKGLQYFVFGPEYLFPGNCYSRSSQLLVPLAEAHRMIAEAESLLWPGRPRQADVAILMPRSALFWDPNGISDATNYRLYSHTVDYMAEIYYLFLAFMHVNIPVDFVDEDQLTGDGLKGVKVLYVTEPNIPEENQKELIKWVKQGGVLVTEPGAGYRDRYNQTCKVLRKGLGIQENDRERLLTPNVFALPTVNALGFKDKFIGAVGVQTVPDDPAANDVMLHFTNNIPALVTHAVGTGRVYQYAWMPGLSYAQSPTNINGMLAGLPEYYREAILLPARENNIKAIVRPDRSRVEAPLLESDAGGVVTLLNWTGNPISNLTVEMDWSKPVKKVRSVLHGKLKFEQKDGIVRWSVPLKSADFIMIQ